jgi:hypothetical protein
VYAETHNEKMNVVGTMLEIVQMEYFLRVVDVTRKLTYILRLRQH